LGGGPEGVAWRIEEVWNDAVDVARRNGVYGVARVLATRRDAGLRLAAIVFSKNRVQERRVVV
jgi:hypothetical protein